MDEVTRAADRTEILICDCCKGPRGGGSDRGGALMAAALERALAARPAAERERVSLRPFSCLMNCSRPCSAGVASAAGRAKISYVLGGLEPGDAAAEGLIDYALRHAESADGVVDYAQWPEAVKGRFVSRTPPRGAP